MSSHPVEAVTTSGADTEAGQHRAGEFATVGRVGKYVRDDAVQLKRLGWLAQRVDDGVTQPPRLRVLGHHCSPALPETIVVGGQLMRCGRRGPCRLSAREVATFDGWQPHPPRPHPTP